MQFRLSTQSIQVRRGPDQTLQRIIELTWINSVVLLLRPLIVGFLCLVFVLMRSECPFKFFPSSESRFLYYNCLKTAQMHDVAVSGLCLFLEAPWVGLWSVPCDISRAYALAFCSAPQAPGESWL